MTENKKIQRLIDNQIIFQKRMDGPWNKIDSILEEDRNYFGEVCLHKCIEEIVELRKEFPSALNRKSKHQKVADMQRIREEFSDVMMFLLNFAICWRLTPETILDSMIAVQDNNFIRYKAREMDVLNTDILKIPNRTSGIGDGSLSPEYVFIGMNPAQGITQGYKFWSNPEDGSSQILLPLLEKLGIPRSSCYFTNIVKCTTEGNQEPDSQLTDFYKEFLVKELDILRFGNPNMKIITLGKWAEKNMVNSYAQMDTPIGNIYHPAYVLRGGITAEGYEEHVNKVLKELNGERSF